MKIVFLFFVSIVLSTLPGQASTTTSITLEIKDKSIEKIPKSIPQKQQITTIKKSTQSRNTTTKQKKENKKTIKNNHLNLNKEQKPEILMVTPIETKEEPIQFKKPKTEPNKNNIVILSITKSSSAYSIAGILCRIFNNFVSSNRDIKCSASQFGNEAAFMKYLTNKENNFGIIASDTEYNIIKNKSYSESDKITHITTLYNIPLIFVYFKDPRSIDKRKIGVLRKNYNTLFEDTINGLEWHGAQIIKYSDYQSLVKAFEDGDINILSIYDYYPNRKISKLFETITDNFKIFNFTKEELDKIISKNAGYKKVIIPPKIYENEVKITTVGVSMDMIVYKADYNIIAKMNRATKDILFITSHDAILDTPIHKNEETSSIFQINKE